jgi:uncharacterized membrane protein YqjE
MLKETLLKFFKLDGLIDTMTSYVETRINLLKYEIREEMAEVIAAALLYFVVGIFFFIFVLIGSVAIAVVIGGEIGYSWSFTIVAAFYLVVAITLLVFRKSIEEQIEARLKKILKKKK